MKGAYLPNNATCIGIPDKHPQSCWRDHWLLKSRSLSPTISAARITGSSLTISGASAAHSTTRSASAKRRRGPAIRAGATRSSHRMWNTYKKLFRHDIVKKYARIGIEDELPAIFFKKR